MNNEQLINEAGEEEREIKKDDPNEDDNGYDQVAQEK